MNKNNKDILKGFIIVVILIILVSVFFTVLDNKSIRKQELKELEELREFCIDDPLLCTCEEEGKPLLMVKSLVNETNYDEIRIKKGCKDLYWNPEFNAWECKRCNKFRLKEPGELRVSRIFNATYSEINCPYMTPNEELIYKTFVMPFTNENILKEAMEGECFIKLVYLNPIEDFSNNRSYFIVDSENYIGILKEINTTKSLVSARYYERLIKNEIK